MQQQHNNANGPSSNMAAGVGPSSASTRSLKSQRSRDSKNSDKEPGFFRRLFTHSPKMSFRRVSNRHKHGFGSVVSKRVMMEVTAPDHDFCRSQDMSLVVVGVSGEPRLFKE